MTGWSATGQDFRSGPEESGGETTIALLRSRVAAPARAAIPSRSRATLQRSPLDRRQRYGEQATLRRLPLPARNERGEGRGEGKALKTLPENDPVFPRHPSRSLSSNTP